MSALSIGSQERPLRVAIVGAGPAGFYTAEALLKRDVHADIDLLERLPAPYGLVRFGVAPDHQKIKSVTKAYDKIAQHPTLRFLGNVRVCQGDLTIDELLDHYDQVVFAVGCETDKKLGIIGEDLAGSHAATSFVAWYNGHPEFCDYRVDLVAERAAVVGVGDVAMDIARMLVKDAGELAKTDIAGYALDAFRASRVREVLVLARRGPGQAAFATKELKDITELPGVDVIVDPADVGRAQADADDLDGLSRRKLDYLAELAEREPKQAPRRVTLRFFTSPVEILGDHGRVSALKLERNELYRDDRGRQRARGTGEFETIPLGLVFRSIGYRGVPLEGVPFDDGWGIIPNEDGRVLKDGTVWPRVYVAGWIKRGPSGVIGTNKGDAAATVDRMLEDLPKLPAAGQAHDRTREAVDRLLQSRGTHVVSFDDWKRLDALELDTGRKLGKAREKLTSMDAMLAALR